MRSTGRDCVENAPVLHGTRFDPSEDVRERLPLQPPLPRENARTCRRHWHGRHARLLQIHVGSVPLQPNRLYHAEIE